jgi:hypothetical protein
MRHSLEKKSSCNGLIGSGAIIKHNNLLVVNRNRANRLDDLTPSPASSWINGTEDSLLVFVIGILT